MERRLTAGAGLLTRVMLALTLALLVGGLVLGVGQNGETWKALALAVPVLIAGWKGLPLLCRWLEQLGAVRIWLVLTLLCLAVKGAWVLLVRVTPSGDYATFWGYANALAQQPVLEGGRYMALFPHIFGYSSFLSWGRGNCWPRCSMWSSPLSPAVFFSCWGGGGGDRLPGFPPICCGLPVPPRPFIIVWFCPSPSIPL